MMELQIYSPTEDQFVKAIEWNYEELKTQIKNELAKYSQLVYTEDSVKNAKETVATLRRFKTAIEDKRKSIKAKCLEPYVEFESKVKEITKLVDQPIEAIAGQIDIFEAKRKAEKIDGLREYFDTQVSDLEASGFVTFEQIENPRWVNVSYAEKTAREEIDAAITQVIKDIGVIESMSSDYIFEMKETYKNTLSLESALAKEAELRQQAERKAAYEKAKQVEVELINQEAPTPEAPTPPERSQQKNTAVKATCRVFSLSFKVTGLETDLMALSDYLKSSNLTVEKI